MEIPHEAPEPAYLGDPLDARLRRCGAGRRGQGQAEKENGESRDESVRLAHEEPPCEVTGGLSHGTGELREA